MSQTEMDDFDRKYYSFVTDFRSLDGRGKEDFIVGDGPDPRVCQLLFHSRVRSHNRTTNQIEFENRAIFRVGPQTYRGQRVYLFPVNEPMLFLWLLASFKKREVASSRK